MTEDKPDQWQRVLAAFGAGPPEPIDVANRIVLFETLWADPADGWAIASRAATRAMAAGGIDVRLTSWAPSIEDHSQEIIEEVRPFLKKPTQWGLYIFSTTFPRPDVLERMDVLGTLGRQQTRRAFYTTFERLRVSPAFREPLNKLDGVWVPCMQNKLALEAIGVENVSCIPFPWFDDDPHLQIPSKNREAKTFYWIGRWEPRKAPDNLVRAFLRAFKPGESKLVLKTSPITWHGRWPDFTSVVKEELDHPEVRRNRWNGALVLDDIQILSGRLPQAAMVNLHALGDVYVSASRGEGTDLPCFAAKLSGNRVVTTDSGGPLDFLGDRDLVVHRTHEVPVDPAYEWEPEATYAGYELDALIGMLQKARREGTTKKRDWPAEAFHYKQVGLRFREFVEKCGMRSGRPWSWR